ncbi:MAG: hypothetical protein LBJ64_02795, partial [Deltaproteobacteria bacterium]|nr:hypothetical protein [Deltaproteobacteria bacterium]
MMITKKGVLYTFQRLLSQSVWAKQAAIVNSQKFWQIRKKIWFEICLPLAGSLTPLKNSQVR